MDCQTVDGISEIFTKRITKSCTYDYVLRMFVHLCGTDQALRRKNENVHFCGTYHVPDITGETKINSQCSFAFQSVLALLTRCVRDEDLKSVFSLVVHLRIVLALSTMCVNILKW